MWKGKTSEISPEETELEALLKGISEREEASETLAQEVGERKKMQLEADKMSVDEIKKGPRKIV